MQTVELGSARPSSVPHLVDAGSSVHAVYGFVAEDRLCREPTVHLSQVLFANYPLGNLVVDTLCCGKVLGEDQ